MNTSLEELDLVELRIGDKGVCEIVESLLANPNAVLKELDIRNCRLTDIGASALLTLMDKFQKLVILIETPPPMYESKNENKVSPELLIKFRELNKIRSTKDYEMLKVKNPFFYLT